MITIILFVIWLIVGLPAILWTLWFWLFLFAFILDIILWVTGAYEEMVFFFDDIL